MNNTKKLLLVALFATTLAGCAGQGMSRPGGLVCAAAGALVAGGATFGAVDVTGAAIGAAAVGGMLGYLACPPEEEKVETVAAVTTPTPPPAPQPPLDSDGDGVPDSRDKCAGTAPGEKVDADGCPEILVTLRGINFRFDSAEILPGSEHILDEGVRALRDSPSVSVEIVGHTDSIGTDEYNMDLGQRRAEAVYNYFVSQGIEASRLRTSSRGESSPVASNETREGRAENRRVELRVIQ